MVGKKGGKEGGWEEGSKVEREGEERGKRREKEGRRIKGINFNGSIMTMVWQINLYCLINISP